MKQLLHDKETSDPKGWAQSQQQIQTAKLQRTRLTREIEDLKAALVQAEADMSHGIESSIISPHILLLCLHIMRFLTVPESRR